MYGNWNKKKAQSFAEYAIVIVLVSLVFMSMNDYIRRGIQSGIKNHFDRLGDQSFPETNPNAGYLIMSYRSDESKAATHYPIGETPDTTSFDKKTVIDDRLVLEKYRSQISELSAETERSSVPELPYGLAGDVTLERILIDRGLALMYGTYMVPKTSERIIDEYRSGGQGGNSNPMLRKETFSIEYLGAE